MSGAANNPPPEPANAPIAWQPFTFRGVAAFAAAPGLRVFLLQVLVAALSAASIVWFLGHRYSPVITQAVQQLPASAGVTNGLLSGFPDPLIFETTFLSIAIAQSDNADIDQIADLQITLRRDRVEISSLLSSALGSFVFPYDRNTPIDLSRSHLEPLWGAWQPAALAEIGVSIVIFLLLLWMALAVVYAPAAKFVAWFCNRRLSWFGAWRLAAAALLPGAILLSVGILLYGWRRVDVFGLAFFAVAHILASWVYLLAAPAFAPPQSAAPPGANPFHPGTDSFSA